MNVVYKIKNKILRCARVVSPVLFVKHRYKKIFGKKLYLKNPVGFNEKILWLSLYWQDPKIVLCADKYTLREYVSKKNLDFLMPTLYGVYNSTNDINWDSFPNKFVIKCTHGCKYNIICFEKNKLNINEATNKLDRWMNEKYGYNTYEPQYGKMIPRIIAEEFIETNAESLPEDYKIYCFNGKPYCVLVCLERETELRLEWYDLDWNILDIGAKPNENKAQKPVCLDKMIEYAEILSKDFPFVRVDFYDSFGKPVLGEMTFSPMYGMATYYSEAGNKQLGDMLKLPQKLKSHF